MEKMSVIKQTKAIITAVVGSKRYGYASDSSDGDYFLLTHNTDIAHHDRVSNITYFLWSIQHIKGHWGHPMLIDDLTADCQGHETLCSFLRDHKHDIAYAAPANTVRFGLEYIGAKESIGIDTAVKPALCTAFILGHMIQGAEDPVLFTEQEKAILTRVRTGEVLSEERVDIYRRTLTTENLDKLRRMPENLTVKNVLFALLDEICKEETP